MNIPNKLTIFRIILIPFFLYFYLQNNFFQDQTRFIALLIFIVASLTDFLDGFIARKYNMISNFGKFADPLADKILVCSALIAMIEKSEISSIIVIIIISREFIITGFRIIAIEQNIVISAGNSGKLKTVFQMILIILILINFNNLIINIVSYITVFLTIFSAIEYIYQNKNVLKNFK